MKHSKWSAANSTRLVLQISIILVSLLVGHLSWALAVSDNWSGGRLRDHELLTVTRPSNGGAILISRHVIVPHSATLELEAGLELQFAPRIGLKIFGSLRAIGTEERKILLTSAESSRSESAGPNRNRLWPDLRLVDGAVPNEGRLQIKYNTQYYSVCSESVRWTTADLSVVCRSLGFEPTSPELYHWWERNNASLQLALRRPSCGGDELSLFHCPNWIERRVGSGSCNLHPDIGIRCSPRLAMPQSGKRLGNWAGIEFLNSKFIMADNLTSKLGSRESASTLRHLVVESAGVDSVGNISAAVRVVGGVAPALHHVVIRSSAGTGLNVSGTDEAISIQHSSFIQNRGYGLFINSSRGAVLLNDVHVDGNGADGLRYVWAGGGAGGDWVVGREDFCTTAMLGTSQIYPLRLTYTQSASHSTKRRCCRTFQVADERSGHEVTVHFTLLRAWAPQPPPPPPPSSHVTADAQSLTRKSAPMIRVFDGYSDELMAEFEVRNMTSDPSGHVIAGHGAWGGASEGGVQSVTSRKGRLRVCHEQALYQRVLFTLDVTTSPVTHDRTDGGRSVGGWSGWGGSGRDYDLFLNKTSLVNNRGRGLWAERPRSGVFLNNTLIVDNGYLAGVHIQHGAELVVNNSLVARNSGDGIKVEASPGGYKHIDHTQILNNTLNGIWFAFNETRQWVAFNFTHHVTRSHVSGNGFYGLRVGALCRAGPSPVTWNISANHFDASLDDAVRVESCMLRDVDLDLHAACSVTKVHVGHNRFNRNRRHALVAAPLRLMSLTLEHNLFVGHTAGVLNIQHGRRGGNSPVMMNTWTRGHESESREEVLVKYNRFLDNSGSYVAVLGVPPHSSVTNPESPRGLFTENILEGNWIQEPFAGLAPRSRAAAVLCIASPSVAVVRNRFLNPLSTYELAAHSESTSPINATLNYWGEHGTNGAHAIYERIFDRKNRYNLARVEFLQYLTRPSDLDSIEAVSFEREQDKAMSFRNGSFLIGGEVAGMETLEGRREFRVYRDIFVRQGARLVIERGATLKFDVGIGMMVQGSLQVMGTSSERVLMTGSDLAASKVFDDDVVALPSGSQVDPLDYSASLNAIYNATESIAVASLTNYSETKSLVNEQLATQMVLNSPPPTSPTRQARQLIGGGGAAGQNVRLSSGTSGWLQARVDGQWGSVCSYEFDEVDAAIACQQMGLVLNRHQSWLLDTRLPTGRVALTGLRCGPLDRDITLCRRERGGTENSCASEVAIRCSQPTWSGLRLGGASDASSVKGLTVERAGMWDYARREFRAAVQVDFNRHAWERITLRENAHSGMEVMWSEVFQTRTISESSFLRNGHDGFVTHSQGLTLSACELLENGRAGLRYDPSLRPEVVADLRRWISPPPIWMSAVAGSVAASLPLSQAAASERDRYLILPSTRTSDFMIQPEADKNYWFLIVPERPKVRPSGGTSPSGGLTEQHTIVTSRGTSIGVMVLVPPASSSTERIVIYRGASPSSSFSSTPLYSSGRLDSWDLSRNLTSFPLLNFGYKLTVEYTPGEAPVGGIVIYLTTKVLPFGPDPSDVTHERATREMRRLIVDRSVVSHNGLGLYASHYSSDESLSANINADVEHDLEDLNLDLNEGEGEAIRYSRYNNETVMILNSRMERNAGHVLLVSSPNSDRTPNSNMAEVNYTLVNNLIRDNGNGIGQVSRDLTCSANLFHWTLNDSAVIGTKAGGLELELPFVATYNVNYTHSVQIWNNSFVGNGDAFRIAIDGHFARLNMSRNTLERNTCRPSSTRGSSRICAMLQLTGTEKEMRISDNYFRNNVAPVLVHFGAVSQADKLGSIEAHFRRNSLLDNSPPDQNEDSATIRLTGCQLLNVTRNLLHNPMMRREVTVAMQGVEGVGSRFTHVYAREADFLVAKLLSANSTSHSLTRLNAAENWWGTVDLSAVRARIFDFHEWNSQPEVLYVPALSQESIHAGLIVNQNEDMTRVVHLDGGIRSHATSGSATNILGGKLEGKLFLRKQERPYRVAADLTIMPSAELLIENGVTLEFEPNVGILVLGELIAAGLEVSPVVMRPAPNSIPVDIRPFQRRTSRDVAHEPPARWTDTALPNKHPSGVGSLRLCTPIVNRTLLASSCEEPVSNEAPTSWTSGPSISRSKPVDGFLELYNTSSFEWIPICDPYFSERNARVVCRQLGLSLNEGSKMAADVTVKHGRRLDLYDPALLSRVRHWPPPLACQGHESALHECPLRWWWSSFSTLNESRPYSCGWESESFVYIHCGKQADGLSNAAEAGWGGAWGGIRFAHANYDDGDSHSATAGQSTSSAAYSQIGGHRSRLEHVHILGAGSLHGERSAALQLVRRDVIVDHVTVRRSAWHGVEVMASPSSISLNKLTVTDNVGIGIHFVTFSRASTGSITDLPYEPLTRLQLPTSAYGMLSACGPDKQVLLQNRILLFYKYGPRPAECIKTFSTEYGAKRIGFRLLHLNLFQSPPFSLESDSLSLHDGHLYNETTKLMVEMTAAPDKRHLGRQFYISTAGTLTVRLRASGSEPSDEASQGSYGFVAEIVSLPLSYNGYHSSRANDYHNVTYSRMQRNGHGGLVYRSAGESTPTLVFHHNELLENGVGSGSAGLYGNFTTTSAAMMLALQNTQHLYLTNNHFGNNVGGLHLEAGSRSAVAALTAFLSNNLFVGNRDRSVLRLETKDEAGDSSYQRVQLAHNYIATNEAAFEDTISVRRVVTVMENNIVVGNSARRILSIAGSFPEVRSNSIYNNVALERNVAANGESRRATIYAVDPGQRYEANYLVNPENDFEIETGNLTTPVNAISAPHNWWGYNETAAVSARIRDFYDSPELNPVEFTPFQILPQGGPVCPGGWERFDVGSSSEGSGTCLVYIGASLPYLAAKAFCESQNGSIPFVRAGSEESLTSYLQSQQVLFDRRINRIWIQSFDLAQSGSECATLLNGRIRKHECGERLPFLCERSSGSGIRAALFGEWYREPLGIAALTLATISAILTIVCFTCWIAKSKQKFEEKLVRRNSIRSLRSYSMNPYSSTGTLTSGHHPTSLVSSTAFLIRNPPPGRAGLMSAATVGPVSNAPTPTFSFSQHPHHIYSQRGETPPVALSRAAILADHGSIMENMSNAGDLDPIGTMTATYENRAFSGTVSGSHRTNSRSSSMDSVPMTAARPFSSMYSEPAPDPELDENSYAETAPIPTDQISGRLMPGPSVGSINTAASGVDVGNMTGIGSVSQSQFPMDSTTSRLFAESPHISSRYATIDPLGVGTFSNLAAAETGSINSGATGRPSFTSQVLLTFRQRQAQRAAEAQQAARQESAPANREIHRSAPPPPSFAFPPQGPPSAYLPRAAPPLPAGPPPPLPRSTSSRLLETSLDDLMSEASSDEGRSYKSRPLETAM